MEKVYDVFTFFNELDLLELRLNILNPIVDRFVIIEADETFSGNPKPLYYLENKERFRKFHHKISHMMTVNIPKSFEDAQDRAINSSDELERQVCIQGLTSSNVPKGETHWLKEFYQKEMIRKALLCIEIDDDDFCFISDLDEIWNPNMINEYVAIDHYKIYKLRQLAYSLYLNNRSNEQWAGTLLTKYRNIRNSCLNHLRTASKTKYEYIENSGWHFSFMGGEEQIKLKIESYGHQEFNNDYTKSNIKNRLDSNTDPLGRGGFNFWVDESDLPKYLIENKNKYKKYFKC